MVSTRCKQQVKRILADLNIPYLTVELGEIILEEAISSGQQQDLACCLLQSGLELIEDHKSVLVEK